MRQVVLDIETTGMNKNSTFYKDHRIIEIGAVEIINRNVTGKVFHTYINPNRSIDIEAFKIHGISDNFLKKKPNFSLIANKFLDFIKNSELIIHNAHFDISFINYEFSLLKKQIKINNLCKIIDSLKLARKIFPGKRNNLDSLCERYFPRYKKRILHSALIDAKLLANIFLLMTTEQMSLDFKNYNINYDNTLLLIKKIRQKSYKFNVIYANEIDIISHNKLLMNMKFNNNNCLWTKNH